MSNEELVSQIQQGVNNCNNMELLYVNNKAYILQIAKKYSKYADIEDLMQEAYFGLYEAVQRYENNHEVKFMTYAGFWIHQAVNRYIGNYSTNVRLPIHLKDNIRKYKKCVNLYKTNLGRNPSDRELCAYLYISDKTLVSIKLAKFQYDQMKSINEEIPSEESDGLFLGDAIADKTDLENDCIESLIESQLETELWQIVQENTNSQENAAINYRYKHRMTLDAAAKEMDTTLERVRQLQAAGLRKLRQSRITRILSEKFEVNMARAYSGSVTNFRYTWTSSTERVALKNLEIDN